MSSDSISLKELECRAEWLGGHAVLQNESPQDILVKPVKLESVCRLKPVKAKNRIM